ncbi:MAG: hypothetical protein IKY92_01475 [Akkermansia sp.]|nr:hypothetical protein [Akkermansia sp.]
MMLLRHIWGICPLLALPVAVGQVETADTPVDVCRRMIEMTHEIGRLLRTVSDQESGRKVAGELKPLLEYMHRETAHLSQLPITSAEEGRELEQAMRDLMHITQGYMPVVQRLNEVNAYGAEDLMQVFRFYKMSMSSSLAADRRDETPLVRSCGEWGDCLEDIIYLLRRAVNADSAAAVMPDLKPAMQRLEDRSLQIMRLQKNLTPHQLEAERLPLERLELLKSEFCTEAERLMEVQGYGVPGLPELLGRCLKNVRS